MNLGADLDQHINIVYEVEKLAMKISKLKSQNIALDRQRQQNVEALRAITTARASESLDSDTIWISPCITSSVRGNGATLLNIDLDVAEAHLKQEQHKIEERIVVATQEMKQLVQDLQLIAPSKGVDPKELAMLLK